MATVRIGLAGSTTASTSVRFQAELAVASVLSDKPAFYDCKHGLGRPDLTEVRRQSG